jgi:hypothetical protein
VSANVTPPPEEVPVTEPEPAAAPALADASFLQKCLPNLAEVECQALLAMLQTEYTQVLPLVQIGMANMAAEVST